MNVPDKNLSFAELYKKIELLVNTKTEELKKEIHDTHEYKYRVAENKILQLERRIRKNNIIIFGLPLNRQTDIVTYVINFLNDKLGQHLVESDINNLYRLGRKNTIVVEFVSYLKKQSLFKNLRNLKGTNVSIANDLCAEDQKNRKLLYKHLKEAKSRNQNAYIKFNKLVVNGEEFTIDQLKNTSLENPEDTDFEIAPLSNSAPATPSIRTELEEEFLGIHQRQDILRAETPKAGNTNQTVKEKNVNEGRMLRAKGKK